MNIILFTNTAHVTRYVLGCRHPLLSSFFDHPLKTRGVFFVVGLCRRGCPNPDPISDQKSHFPHPSSDLPEAEIMLLLLRLERQQKRFLKIHFEFAYYSFLLVHLELKRQTRSYTPVFPQKPYPIPDQNRQYLNYRKIPKISPGSYIFQRPILRGLFLEGLIFGGTYIGREICVSKSIGLAL